MTTPTSSFARIAAFQALKGQRNLVCLTAYTAPMASALNPYCDLLLVGDSVGMAVYGMDTTHNVDLQMMIRHGQAVMRRRQNALVVVDLPKGSYEDNPEQALHSGQLVITKTGADAVKLEGGADRAATLSYLCGKGIQVMGHIGLLPQSATAMRATGQTAAEADQLAADMRAVIAAGVFSVVIEGVIEPVAGKLAAACRVPTIGIGASAACDGQILVTDDMLGLYDGHTPKFVRPFAVLKQDIAAAAKAYRAAVIDGTFPDKREIYLKTLIDRKN